MITPGPWNVSRHATPEHSPQFGVYAEGQQNDMIIIRHENAEANAAAIAALPDLIEALTHICQTLEGHPQVRTGNSKVHFVYHQARQALRKARGE